MEHASSPDTLDPAVVVTIEATEVMLNIYQPLVTLGPNATIKPILASSYTVSADGRTYTFTLRQGITFSNGDPFNAYTEWYAVYRSALMGQEPAGFVRPYLDASGVTADMLNQFNTPDNVPPSALLQVMQNPNLAITVLGPYEIAFHLKGPSGSFLSAGLTAGSMYPVDPRLVTQNGGVKVNSTNPWMVTNAVGTGPFILTSFQPNSQTILQRNPTYWGGANGVQPTPKLDKVIIKVVPDDLTRLLDIQRGSAQVSLIPFSLVSQAAGAGGIYIPGIGTSGAIQYLGMDTLKWPTNITLVRQAISHAINEDELLKLYFGLGKTFVGPNVHGDLGYNESRQPPTFNVTLAKQLLTQAGFPNGQGFPMLTMIVPNNRPPAVEVAQVIQQNLADVGIQVTLKEVAAAQRNQIIANTDPTDPAYPNLLYMTLAGPPDPDQWLPYIVGPSGRGGGVFNSAQYKDATVDSLIAQQSLTADLQQRAALVEQVTGIVYQAEPYYWIAQFNNAYLVGVPISSVKVGGFVVNPLFVGDSCYDFSTLFLTS